ncbi:hypothetical protein GCM10009129_13760 [Psychrobacter aestuarii]|uniref:Uncharacterized protein n=1 Tax=Psychrobacter aestuarii TaxID=556327 RepID=A0ABP3FKP6_9GAMM
MLKNMRILKYSLLFIVLFIVLSITYSYILSPRIEVVNLKNYDLKLFRGESNANSIEPSLEEVDRMLNSTTTIRPQESYSFSIRREYVFSSEKNKVNMALYDADSINTTSTEYSNEFFISDSGFCKYTIEIYNDYIDVKTSSFNICYKRLLMVE